MPQLDSPCGPCSSGETAQAGPTSWAGTREVTWDPFPEGLHACFSVLLWTSKILNSFILGLMCCKWGCMVHWSMRWAEKMPSSHLQELWAPSRPSSQPGCPETPVPGAVWATQGPGGWSVPGTGPDWQEWRGRTRVRPCYVYWLNNITIISLHFVVINVSKGNPLQLYIFNCTLFLFFSSKGAPFSFCPRPHKLCSHPWKRDLRRDTTF